MHVLYFGLFLQDVRIVASWALCRMGVFISLHFFNDVSYAYSFMISYVLRQLLDMISRSISSYDTKILSSKLLSG